MPNDAQRHVDRHLPRRTRWTNDTKDNLVEFGLGQLTLPLTDRYGRFPMPAGGLFSIASDTAIFCQMLLRGGELGGKRYLSEAAMAELTKRQTPETLEDNYSFGFAIGSDWLGHGRGHATNMEIHHGKGLVTFWMVQHGGDRGEGKNAHGAFKNWAYQKFAKRRHARDLVRQRECTFLTTTKRHRGFICVYETHGG